MNKMAFALTSLLLLLLGLASGCTKTNPAVFTWYYMNDHYVADSSSVYETSSPADDRIVASCSTVGLTALGIDGGGKLEVGSYTFHNVNSSGQPYMFYDYVGTLYSQSGTLTITNRSSTQMSGTFTVTYTDGTTMTGSFTDIPIE